MDEKSEVISIDYSLLMDLRVDFAFKTFIEGNIEALISLLNAIFANAKLTVYITKFSELRYLHPLQYAF